MIVLVGRDNGMPEQEQAKQTCRCLKAARELVEKENITLVIEPLNTFDRKGYAMPYADQVLSVLREVGSPNIKMLYDIYHQNMMGDFSMEVIRDNIDMIGHFHVADCPGRHEPGTGKVDYPRILGEIERLPYSGCVGLEYRATKADDETFGFLKEVPHV